MLFSHLSWRARLPLAMIAIVIVTEAVVTIALINRAIRDSRADLSSNARSLSAALSRSLRDPLLRDDVWQAFEIVRMPLHSLTQTDPLREILTLDQNGKIFAASDPFRYQTATHVTALTDIVAGDISSVSPPLFKLLDPDELGLNRLVALNPIQADDGSILGMVAILYDSEIFTERSLRAIREVIWLSFPGMLILIPLAWFLGGRLAQPLSQLSESISRIGQDSVASIRSRLPPPGKDEIGVLSQSAHTLLHELEKKSELERQVMTSNRLAAVGRVAAGIAHEIKNPVGGMLNAVDTALRHGRPDAFMQRTLGLIERGLDQILATVSALLVEARRDSPELTFQDIDDLKVLIQPAADLGGVKCHWEVDFSRFDTVRLPAHDVRQVLLNLLLNAIEAAQGKPLVEQQVGEAQHRIMEVLVFVEVTVSELTLRVANSGPPIPDEQRATLFEPFIFSEDKRSQASYGLGLWVCYRIVNRLGGVIDVDRLDGLTQFSVTIPIPVRSS